ncbi:MAG: response regulator [Candidatus Cloacimonetes bacterium]|nr:response regulator [Candidatus Cloacimonadota bacterium]
MKKRILIVEDDLLIAESMRDAIYECGYDVANIVTNGLDAINEVVEDCPDLVLMDIRIQGTMDGIETAK